jgi:hypothetical protein
VKEPLVFGFALVVVDVALWRITFVRNDTLRVLLRILNFGLLSWVLFVSSYPSAQPVKCSGKIDLKIGAVPA